MGTIFGFSENIKNIFFYNQLKGKHKLKEIWEEDCDKGFELNFGIFIWPDGRKNEGYWKKTNNMEKVIITLRKEKWEDDSGKADKEIRK